MTSASKAKAAKPQSKAKSTKKSKSEKLPNPPVNVQRTDRLLYLETNECEPHFVIPNKNDLKIIKTSVEDETYGTFPTTFGTEYSDGSIRFSLDLSDLKQSQREALREIILEQLSPEEEIKFLKWEAKLPLDIQMEDLLKHKISRLSDLSTIMNLLKTNEGTHPMFQASIIRKPWPIFMKAEFQKGFMFSSASVRILAELAYGDHKQRWSFQIAEEDLQRLAKDLGRQPNILEILQIKGVTLSTMGEKEYFDWVKRIEAVKNRRRTPIDITGPIVYRRHSYFGIELVELLHGTPTEGKLGIIDGETEVIRKEERDLERFVQESRIPLIRVFAMGYKSWIFVDMDDMKDHVFNDNALDSIVMPEGRSDLLMAVLKSTSTNTTDVIAGRHGGIVVLASGTPGTGKTLTAEVMSEVLHKPLYPIDFADLGTRPEVFEENLSQALNRASIWNALPLIDEAEILIRERGTDLTQAALVAVFLKLLDRYNGLLFLTTNRADVIDPAMQSRIAMHFRYEDLTPETRSKIWNLLLSKNKVTMSEADVKVLSELGMNGRQIRNLIRVGMAVNAQRTLNEKSPMMVEDWKALASEIVMLQFGVRTAKQEQGQKKEKEIVTSLAGKRPMTISSGQGVAAV